MGRKLSPIDPLASTIALAGKQHGIYFSPGFNPPLRSSIPVVFTIHDLIHVRVPAESTALRRLYYAHVVRPAAQRAARILTVSEYSRRDICEWAGLPPDQVVVVGNGVSSAFHPDGPRHTGPEPYFLHVGRRAGHKNIVRLLEAFSRGRYPQAMRMRFTGLPDRTTVSVVERLGLRTRVDFLGQLSDTALASHYRSAMALVFPSIYEGFGLPIVEAMACGTPVVTSSTTATAEVAGPGNAVLVDPGSTEALAAAMERIASDAQLRSDLAQRGPRRAMEFSWERVASRTLEALDVP